MNVFLYELGPEWVYIFIAIGISVFYTSQYDALAGPARPWLRSILQLMWFDAVRWVSIGWWNVEDVSDARRRDKARLLKRILNVIFSLLIVVMVAGVQSQLMSEGASSEDHE